MFWTTTLPFALAGLMLFAKVAPWCDLGDDGHRPPFDQEIDDDGC